MRFSPLFAAARTASSAVRRPRGVARLLALAHPRRLLALDVGVDAQDLDRRVSSLDLYLFTPTTTFSPLSICRW